MKKEDLKKKKTSDLAKEVFSLKEKLREDSFSPAGLSKDSSFRKKTRKQIARILTELSSRNDK